MPSQPIQTISVIVPENPFVPPDVKTAQHCLAALDVTKLMEWWPGTPHSPHRNPKKIKAIQRSLDWKRVGQIAAYLLQKEIIDAPERLAACFEAIYEVKKHEKGRIWPPRVPRVISYVRSSYPVFSNVLLHLNGATVKKLPDGAAKLTFKEDDADLNFSVIDGQHRINGAYFAVMLSREVDPTFKWEIPAEIFLDLDATDAPPKRQAQIFIDVNFYQKKVDRSLVADLFPTTREPGMLGEKERSQDLGRKLMLEVGPLVGMIQIPGIKYGVGDVVTLATLNSAIENVLKSLDEADISSLEDQASFLAQCLEAWLDATGRREDVTEGKKLTPQNVVYQGRVMVSFVTLIPACLWTLKKNRIDPLGDQAKEHLTAWLKKSLKKASLLEDDQFIDKSKFKERGYLGSGGIARFRDVLWCSVGTTARLDTITLEEKAEEREKFAAKSIRSSAMAINIPLEMRTYVDVLFAPLDAASAAHSFPQLGHLAATLLDDFPNRDELQVTIDRQKSKYFATASVEAWHRAIHSFLISCSLTTASPLWSSVSGYYASHYAMRAISHLLGYFLLYDRKLVIRMTLDGGGHHCNAIKNDAGSGEHKFYWKVVKKIPFFSADPLFTLNPENTDVSDSAHRNRANYAYHVSRFPQFAPLNNVSLTNRVERISSIEMQVPPIPNRRSYPDLDSVQIVAYQRIIRYRRIVDEILGGKNRFWNVQRSPAFANAYCDYQITESGNLSIYREAL